MTTDYEDIRHLIASVAHHIDAKRWRELRALYADEVATDYTSLFGGSPQRQAADALRETWQTVLARVATHHLLGPIDVELAGDTARARCHVRAMHVGSGAADGSEWEVLGHYRFELVRGPSGFRITSMTLETTHQTGNRKLLEQV